MKTYMAKPAEVERKWYVVDATDMVLGRLASQVAMRRAMSIAFIMFCLLVGRILIMSQESG